MRYYGPELFVAIPAEPRGLFSIESGGGKPRGQQGPSKSTLYCGSGVCIVVLLACCINANAALMLMR